MLFKYFLFLILVLKCVNSAKILGIIYTPFYGYHRATVQHLQALAKKGHIVHLLSTFQDKVNIPTYKQTLLTGMYGPEVDVIKDAPIINEKYDLPSNLLRTAENFWNNKKVKELVRDRPYYDVVVILAYYADHIYPLARHLRGSPPLILFVPFSPHYMENKYVGMANLPYYTHSYVGLTPDYFYARHGFLGNNILVFLGDKFMVTAFHEEVTRKFLPDALPLIKLNVSLMLINTHIALETPRPYLPNMIQVGGFIPSDEPMDEKCREFLDSAKDGAIVLSMPTNLNISISEFMRSFGSLYVYKFLVKSKEKIRSAPKNVLVVDRIKSQANVLGHKNVKLFITHGGYDGVMEAIYHGKKIFGIPFTGEQRKLITYAVDNGFGVKVEPKQVGSFHFLKSLHLAIDNTTLDENASQRSLLLKNQPINPVDHACWWVEHIIEHKGGEHLKTVAINFTWYELYMVDVVVCVFLMIFNPVCLYYYFAIWLRVHMLLRRAKKLLKELKSPKVARTQRENERLPNKVRVRRRNLN